MREEVESKTESELPVNNPMCIHNRLRSESGMYENRWITQIFKKIYNRVKDNHYLSNFVHKLTGYYPSQTLWSIYNHERTEIQALTPFTRTKGRRWTGREMTVSNIISCLVSVSESKQSLAQSGSYKQELRGEEGPSINCSCI